MSDTKMIIRNMRREELDTLVDWAAAEGWNPGLNDAQIFWDTDPEGFIAAEMGGELIGGGSIVSYDGRFGFMGFFIIHPDHRGQGLGNTLWHARLQRLVERLQKPAIIGMDGVFDMQSYYAKGGFRFSARDLRFEGVGRFFESAEGVTELATLSFAEIETYDRAHFPAPRSDFLNRWLEQPGAYGIGSVHDGHIQGFGIMRPCREGYKIGPLFADNFAIAQDIFKALSSRVSGETIFLDVPENNPEAVALAQHHDMQEVFGCAKMYFGPEPDLPVQEIFGVTTFELG